MSKLITTITVGAVATLIGMAAMATHEGTQGSNMGTGSTAQQGADPSQLRQQQAQQQFAIDEQDCGTLRYQKDHKTYDPSAYEQCMHQAATRRDQQAMGGGIFAGSQERGQAGEKKDTGIIDKFTTAVKDKLADFGMGTGSDRQAKDVGGQPWQGAQQGHAQAGQPQAWQGGQQAWQGQQPQQGHAQGQGGAGFQQGASGGEDQLQIHPFDPEIAEGGLTSAERYLLQHGSASPEFYALDVAIRQYAIQRQECETLKYSVPQSFEQCLQQAARDPAMGSGLSDAAPEAHKGTQERGS